MEKPIEIRIKEFECDLIKIVNEANMPPFIVRPIFEKIYNQLINLEQQSFEKKKIEYEQSLQEGGEENGQNQFCE